MDIEMKNLITAIGANDLETVKSYVPSKYNANERTHPTSEYMTVFQSAVNYGSFDIVMYLYQNGGDPNHKAFGGAFYEKFASNPTKGTAHIEWALSLNLRPANVALYNMFLQNAVIAKNVDAIHYCVKLGANPNVAMYNALGNAEMYRRLFAEGADPYYKEAASSLNAVEFALHRGQPHPLVLAPLKDKVNRGYVAVYNNDLVTLQEMYDAGELFDVKLPYLEPLMIVAARYASLETVQKLVSFGLSPTVLSETVPAKGEVTRGNNNMLIAAAERQFDASLLDYILELGNDVNFNSGFETALTRATKCGNLETITYLLFKKANPNDAATPRGCAGHIAVLMQRTDILSTLLQNGLNVNTPYPSIPELGFYAGMSVWNLALGRNNSVVIKTLKGGK